MLNKLLAHNQVTLGQQLLSSQYTIHNCSWWDLKTSLLLAFKLWIICIFVVKNVEMYAKTRRVWVHSSMVLSAFIVVEYTRPWFLHAYRWFLVWECVCNSACVGGSRASWKRAGVKHTSLSIHSEIKRYMCWWQDAEHPSQLALAVTYWCSNTQVHLTTKMRSHWRQPSIQSSPGTNAWSAWERVHAAQFE